MDEYNFSMSQQCVFSVTKRSCIRGYFNRNVWEKRANYYSSLHCAMETTFRVLHAFGLVQLKMDVEKTQGLLSKWWRHTTCSVKRY